MANLLVKFNFKKIGLQSLLNDYFKPFHIKVYIIFFLVSNLLLWLLVWLIVANINQDLAILHYNIIFGIDYIGQPRTIFLLPIYGFGLGLGNWFLSLLIFRKNKLLIHLLMASTLVSHIFLGLAAYSIYLVNFVNIKL